jgi:hypothetical protein
MVQSINRFFSEQANSTAISNPHPNAKSYYQYYASSIITHMDFSVKTSQRIMKTKQNPLFIINKYAINISNK